MYNVDPKTIRAWAKQLTNRKPEGSVRVDGCWYPSEKEEHGVAEAAAAPEPFSELSRMRYYRVCLTEKHQIRLICAYLDAKPVPKAVKAFLDASFLKMSRKKVQEEASFREIEEIISNLIKELKEKAEKEENEDA